MKELWEMKELGFRERFGEGRAMAAGVETLVGYRE